MSRPASHHPPSPEVHGRDREWFELAGALTRAKRGSPRGVIIEGARGQGRSRMLRELVAAARHDGRMVIEREGWRPVPVTGHLTAELTQLVNQISTAELPFVVAWDDPPWPHQAFTTALSNAMAEAPIFWALTRNTDLVPPAALPPIATAAGEVLCVELAPLNETAMTAIAADLLDRRLAPELAALMTVAGGSPGLLHELIAGLCDEGLVDLSRPVARLIADRLPARIRVVLRHGLADLSPEAHHLAQVTSVLAVAPSLDDLALLLDTRAVALMPAVLEAMAANLFRLDQDQVAFTHDLVRSLVAETVPPAVARPVREAGARLAFAHTRATNAVDLTVLTPAELGVARLVHEGLSNKQVAHRLRVSPHTVNYHLRSIYPKLKINGRVDLARLPWPEIAA